LREDVVPHVAWPLLVGRSAGGAPAITVLVGSIFDTSSACSCPT
jgi:hypothetical protein